MWRTCQPAATSVARRPITLDEETSPDTLPTEPHQQAHGKPEQVKLNGRFALTQLVVMGIAPSGNRYDLTRLAKIEANNKLVEVSATVWSSQCRQVPESSRFRTVGSRLKFPWKLVMSPRHQLLVTRGMSRQSCLGWAAMQEPVTVLRMARMASSFRYAVMTASMTRWRSPTS